MSEFTRRHGITDRKRYGSINTGDVACLVIPALSFLRFQMVGVLYATDACLVLAVIVLLATAKRPFRDPQVRRFVIFGMLWFAAQIITDFTRDVPFEDYARGWSKIALTITHFVAIALLIQGSGKRMVLYGVGWAIGGLLTFFLAPTEYALVAPWKFGPGIPVTLLVCLIAALLARRHPVAGASLILTMAAVNFYADFRSLGLVCSVAAVYSYVHQTSGITYYRRRPALQGGRFPLSPRRPALHRRRSMVTVGAVVGLGLWGTWFLYAHAAENGWLGAEALDKYRQQSEGAGGVLVGGRSYFLSALSAIADSPILGHGSWAKDSKYNDQLRQDLQELGYKNPDAGRVGEPIPAHSYLLGAWVDAGVLGFVFWASVLAGVVKALIGVSGREPLLPFCAMVILLLLWNILFSPYGADERFTATYSIYVSILIQRFSRKRGRDKTYRKPMSAGVLSHA